MRAVNSNLATERQAGGDSCSRGARILRAIRSANGMAWLAIVLFAVFYIGFGLDLRQNTHHTDTGNHVVAVSRSAPETVAETAAHTRSNDRRGEMVAKVQIDSPRFSMNGSVIPTILDDDSPLTIEEVDALEAILALLQKGGVEAIPDIRALLESRQDRMFSPSSARILGVSTLRIALIDVLERIGGIEAELLLAEQLASFQSLSELEALSDALQSIAPGFYAQHILEIAAEQLALLFRSSSLDAETDAAPLFRIYQQHGDNQSAALLSRAPDWLREYAQLALAQLPGEQGIEALVRHARRDINSAEWGNGLHLLAQMAVSSRVAENALLSLAESGRIPDEAWPAIGEILIGDRQLQTENPELANRAFGSINGGSSYTTHTRVSKQTQIIYSVNYSAVLPPEQVRIRIALLGRLAQVTENPVAINSLWSAYDNLRHHYPLIP